MAILDYLPKFNVQAFQKLSPFVKFNPSPVPRLEMPQEQFQELVLKVNKRNRTYEVIDSNDADDESPRPTKQAKVAESTESQNIKRARASNAIEAEDDNIESSARPAKRVKVTQALEAENEEDAESQEDTQSSLTEVNQNSGAQNESVEEPQEVTPSNPPEVTQSLDVQEQDGEEFQGVAYSNQLEISNDAQTVPATPEIQGADDPTVNTAAPLSEDTLGVVNTAARAPEDTSAIVNTAAPTNEDISDTVNIAAPTSQGAPDTTATLAVTEHPDDEAHSITQASAPASASISAETPEVTQGSADATSSATALGPKVVPSTSLTTSKSPRHAIPTPRRITRSAKKPFTPTIRAVASSSSDPLPSSSIQATTPAITTSTDRRVTRASAAASLSVTPSASNTQAPSSGKPGHAIEADRRVTRAATDKVASTTVEEIVAEGIDEAEWQHLAMVADLLERARLDLMSEPPLPGPPPCKDPFGLNGDDSDDDSDEEDSEDEDEDEEDQEEEEDLIDLAMVDDNDDDDVAPGADEASTSEQAPDSRDETAAGQDDAVPSTEDGKHAKSNGEVADSEEDNQVTEDVDGDDVEEGDENEGDGAEGTDDGDSASDASDSSDDESLILPDAEPPERIGIPRIHFKSTATPIPPYYEYTTLKQCFLSRDERELYAYPELEDWDENEALHEGLEKHHLGRTPKARTRQLPETAFIMQFEKYLQHIFLQCGVAVEEVLGYILQPDAVLKDLLKPDMYEKIKDRDPFCARPCDRGSMRVVKLLSLLPQPNAHQLQLAHEVCSVMLNTSRRLRLWPAIEWYNMENLKPKANPGDEDAVAALEKQGRLQCRICYTYDCHFHGEYQSSQDGKVSSAEASSDSSDAENYRARLTARMPLDGEDEKLPARTCLDAITLSIGQTDTGSTRNVPEGNPSEEEVFTEAFHDTDLCSKECFWKISNRLDDNLEGLTLDFTRRDERLLRKLFQKLRFEARAPCIISQSLPYTCSVVYMKLKEYLRGAPRLPTRGSNSRYPRRRGIGRQPRQKTFRKSKEMMERPYFFPCNHTGPCDVANGCRCAAAEVNCEKFCNCPPDCDRHFKGCDCKRTRTTCHPDWHCACRAAGRECDPDLCHSCGAAEIIDPAIQEEVNSETQACTNVQMLRHHQVFLLIGNSAIAGYGLFAGEAIKKGEFVCEYKGELLSEEETNRRGDTYYYLKNYLFTRSLTATTQVDGFHAANLARYANHSSDRSVTNMIPTYRFVNGIVQISLYSTRDIAVGEELFFDYGYRADLLEKTRFKEKNGMASINLVDREADKHRKTKEAKTVRAIGLPMAIGVNGPAMQAPVQDSDDQQPPKKKQRAVKKKVDTDEDGVPLYSQDSDNDGDYQFEVPETDNESGSEEQPSQQRRSSLRLKRKRATTPDDE